MNYRAHRQTDMARTNPNMVKLNSPKRSYKYYISYWQLYKKSKATPKKYPRLSSVNENEDAEDTGLFSQEIKREYGKSVESLNVFFKTYFM